jgi:hypothetical protein
MRIDVWTHVLSRAYVEQLEGQGQRGPVRFCWLSARCTTLSFGFA